MHKNLPIFPYKAYEHTYKALRKAIKILPGRKAIRIIQRHNFIILIDFSLTSKQLNPKQAKHKHYD